MPSSDGAFAGPSFTTPWSSERSVAALVKAIEEYLEHSNENPKPFVWTASVDQILEKVSICKATLETLY